jgi:isoquinoline 1-oxidoreductase beta subunit
MARVEGAFTRASTIREAQYYVPHLAHAALEPPAAVAEYKEGKVVAWAATQNPQAVQATVARALGLKPQDVICYVTLLGGGFGRKSKPDYVAEAAMLSKQLGKPVKVAWSREDDLQFDYYHTVAAMYMKARRCLPQAWCSWARSRRPRGRSSNPTTTTSRWRGSTRHLMRLMCISCQATSCRLAWANQACRR